MASLHPDVILVLGAPSQPDLEPLLHSPHLTASLLILATHNPPPIPAHPSPAVRVLRIPAPLISHEDAAVRLVALLKRAHRAASAWRAHPAPAVLELPDLPPSPPRPRFSRRRSSSPSQHPPLRPFDLLLNFLPPRVPDKALLKHAILVTTISRPFLATPLPLSPLASPPRARLRHLLPPAAAPPLARSINAFLRSFAPAPTDPTASVLPAAALRYPTRSAASSVSSGSGSSTPTVEKDPTIEKEKFLSPLRTAVQLALPPQPDSEESLALSSAPPTSRWRRTIRRLSRSA